MGKKLDKDTKRLLSEVRKELHAVKREIKQREDSKLLETYRELLETIE